MFMRSGVCLTCNMWVKGEAWERNSDPTYIRLSVVARLELMFFGVTAQDGGYYSSDSATKGSSKKADQQYVRAPPGLKAMLITRGNQISEGHGPTYWRS